MSETSQDESFASSGQASPQTLMHLHSAGAEAAAIVVELDVLVIGEQGHRHAGVGEAFGNHERGEALTERIVMHAGMPDADFFSIPGLFGADGDGRLGNHGDVATTRSASVLSQGDRMQLDDTGTEFSVFSRRWWFVLPFTAAFEGIIKGPMLDIALTALHDDAAHAAAPAFDVGAGVGFWEMQLAVWHDQLFLDAVKAEFTVGFFKGKRVIHADFLFGLRIIPLIHAPEVAVFNGEAELVDESGHQRQLLGGADRATNASGVVRSGLFPGVDVFQSFRQIKVLKCVIHDHLEAGAGQLSQVAFRESCGIMDQGGVQSGVVPPVGSDVAELAWHGV